MYKKGLYAPFFTKNKQKKHHKPTLTGTSCHRHKYNNMLELTRHRLLTEDEMKGIAGTDLFAALMRHKYHLVADDVEELNVMLARLVTELEHTWYFQRTGTSQGRSGMIYVADAIDSKTLEKILNDNRCTTKTSG